MKRAKPNALTAGLSGMKHQPAATPNTRHPAVTWSGETAVGSSARASHIPRGRKKWRSTASSTARPLLASASAAPAIG